MAHAPDKTIHTNTDERTEPPLFRSVTYLNQANVNLVVWKLPKKPGFSVSTPLAVAQYFQKLIELSQHVSIRTDKKFVVIPILTPQNLFPVQYIDEEQFVTKIRLQATIFKDEHWRQNWMNQLDEEFHFLMEIVRKHGQEGFLSPDQEIVKMKSKWCLNDIKVFMISNLHLK